MSTLAEREISFKNNLLKAQRRAWRAPRDERRATSDEVRVALLADVAEAEHPVVVGTQLFAVAEPKANLS